MKIQPAVVDISLLVGKWFVSNYDVYIYIRASSTIVQIHWNWLRWNVGEEYTGLIFFQDILYISYSDSF